MTSLINQFKNIEIKQRHVPWVLLGVCLLAYGILIHRLGFYWDDWPTLFYASAAADDPSMIHLFPFRPLHVYLDIWTVKILGYTPIYWHILMFVIRYLGGLAFWLFLKELWPQKQHQNAWIAILFLVYPAFMQQAMSVIYRQHFSTALLYLFSMYLLVKSLNSRRKGKNGQFWIFYLLSIAFGTVHLFLMEYFSAMELLRLFVILAVVLREKPKAWKAVRKVLSYWLPYLVYLISFVIWRMRQSASVANDRNSMVLLEHFLSDPFNTLASFIQTVLLDLKQLLVGSWMDIFTTDLFDIKSPFSLGVLGLIAISSVVLYFVFIRFQEPSSFQEGKDSDIEYFGIGIMGMFLGLAPGWLIGSNLIDGRYAERFSIPALAGVSILVVSLLFYLISERRKLILTLSILIAFSVGNQIQTNNIFRWDWERQTRAFWQLHWRAPEIEPNTAVLVNKALTSYVTTYPVAAALNFMYAYDHLSMTPDYWWFEIFSSELYNDRQELLQGGGINPDLGELTLEMNGDESLVIFLPSGTEPNKCLWLLTEQDGDNLLLPKEMRTMAALTDLSRIYQNTEVTLPADIFGVEPSPNWCTYYQKAQLAAQFDDWETVAALFDQVQKEGMRSSYGYEYLTFITASMEIDDWEQAVKYTRVANRLTPKLESTLCNIWEMYPENHQPNNEDYFSSYSQVQEVLGCSVDE